MPGNIMGEPAIGYGWSNNGNLDVSELNANSGIVRVLETATPAAVANYGKIYTKSDNKLYFQDGAGTEHEVAYAP